MPERLSGVETVESPGHWCSIYQDLQRQLTAAPDGESRQLVLEELRDHRVTCSPCIDHFKPRTEWKDTHPLDPLIGS